MTALELALEGLDAVTTSARVRLDGMRRLLAMLGEHLDEPAEIVGVFRPMEQLLEGDLDYLVERRRIIDELLLAGGGQAIGLGPQDAPHALGD